MVIEAAQGKQVNDGRVKARSLCHHVWWLNHSRHSFLAARIVLNVGVYNTDNIDLRISLFVNAQCLQLKQQFQCCCVNAFLTPCYIIQYCEHRSDQKILSVGINV